MSAIQIMQICAVISILLLTGCGQKGPLFIPQDSLPTGNDAPQRTDDREKPDKPA